MSRVVLQVPINAVLRKDAEKAAEKLGFSSLQELLRVFLHKFSRGEISITFRKPSRSRSK